MYEQKKGNTDSDEKKPIIIRNSTDLQRLKLEKLMQNPDKPVIIPEKTKERGMPLVPDFVRNVMGSSAGAGSGEFHVYRHLRRKEYARQKYMKEKAEKEKLEDDYHRKLEENRKKAEERTAKKRLKRLKKKQKQKKCKKAKVVEKSSSSSEESEGKIDSTEDFDMESKSDNSNRDAVNKECDDTEDTDVESKIVNSNQDAVNKDVNLNDAEKKNT